MATRVGIRIAGSWAAEPPDHDRGADKLTLLALAQHSPTTACRRWSVPHGQWRNEATHCCACAVAMGEGRYWRLAGPKTQRRPDCIRCGGELR